jgi:hypothetical protein
MLRNRGVFMPIQKFKNLILRQKHLAVGGIRTYTFIVKNCEHYHSAMVTTFSELARFKNSISFDKKRDFLMRIFCKMLRETAGFSCPKN